MPNLDTCLQKIMTRLVVDLSNSNKLQVFRNTFQKRKIYNQREKAYIENEKIKLQLGTEYDSQESDLEQEFGSLSKYEMKCLLKENLIKNKFDQNKLSAIEPPTPQDISSDRVQVDKQDLQSFNRRIDRRKDLKVITENKTSHILGKKNFEALDFVIQELQNILKK